VCLLGQIVAPRPFEAFLDAAELEVLVALGAAEVKDPAIVSHVHLSRSPGDVRPANRAFHIITFISLDVLLWIF
jgi:hypothetical protein